MSTAAVAQAREIIWDYMKLHGDVPDRVSAIVVLGSSDDRVAELAADIAHKVASSVIIVTGGVAHKSDMLATPDWPEATEAEHFATVMRKSGCQRQLVLETKATNTGENVRYAERIVRDMQIEPVGVLIVTKPYMERRSLRTFEKQWTYDTPKFYTISSRQTFDEYVAGSQDAELVTNIMVGDLDRLIQYPARGLMTESQVPGAVLDALRVLKDAGYTKHAL